jgi:hypothetical protein
VNQHPPAHHLAVLSTGLGAIFHLVFEPMLITIIPIVKKIDAELLFSFFPDFLFPNSDFNYPHLGPTK